MKGKKCLFPVPDVAQYTVEKVNQLAVRFLRFPIPTALSLTKQESMPRSLNSLWISRIPARQDQRICRQIQTAKYYEAKPVAAYEGRVASRQPLRNELDINDAKVLVDNGCYCVAEGAKMPPHRRCRVLHF
jgi:glutamate dehydrogenase (NADP+)